MSSTKRGGSQQTFRTVAPVGVPEVTVRFQHQRMTIEQPSKTMTRIVSLPCRGQRLWPKCPRSSNDNTVLELRLVRDADATFTVLVEHGDAVTIRFTAGYGEAADVPADAIHAIKLLVGHWFVNRESVTVGLTSARVPQTYQEMVENNNVGDWFTEIHG